jgi:acyl-CoA synthetase (AMP-forming)/AMP-acid ligase II
MTGTFLSADGSWWDLIERRAELTPDRIMLTDDRGRRRTFGEYRAEAEAVAAGLAGIGVAPGQVVSWQLAPTIEAAVLMAALARLGVTQNPIVPILRHAEVGQIVEQLEPDLLVVPGERRGFDHAAMARQVTDGHRCRVLVCDELGVGRDGVALPTGGVATLRPPVLRGDEVRWCFYSSGTTAAPKGVRHTDRSAMASAKGLVEQVGFSADDVFPVAWPISHIAGVMMLTAQLQVAAQLVLIEAFDPVRSPVVMAEHGATMLGSAVPFFRAYLAAQKAHGADPLFPRLRVCMAGGAPMPAELEREVEETLGARICNAWGLTECPTSTSLAAGDPEEKFLGSVGRPVRGVEVRVVEGELRLKGPQRFVGYVDASLDRDAFDEDGFFRTGDLGYVDEDGYVWITGRLKDVIIRNAENISAVEIENALYQHPAVADVAVVGLPDPRTGERCCALIVVADGAEAPSLSDLVEHCRALGLAPQKAPEQLEILAELPRNAMGKLLKHELRARLLDDVPG